MERLKNKVYPITGSVQHYAWGGFFYLQNLLRLEEKNGVPNAEYWLGAHAGGVATIVDGGAHVSLRQYIEAFPQETLGDAVRRRFGRLPYLLKLLDVRDMLSIQVHPAKEAAGAAFEAEDRAGVARNAANRNYKDDNHKPELMYALGDFWLLHGFKSPALLRKILAATPELNFLTGFFSGDDYRALYRQVMEMPQEEVNRRLQPLLDRIGPAYEAGKLSRDQEDFWAARAAVTYNKPGLVDRGIFSIYLFNVVHAKRGDALFQGAGLPHAYLEGQNVEIMANSDNVLRGGLTPKHVDVPELLKHIRFEETVPQPVRTMQGGGITRFLTPAPDFELGRIGIAPGGDLRLVSVSACLYLVLSGEISVTESGKPGFARRAGEAWVSFDGAIFHVKAAGAAEVFRASVPPETAAWGSIA